MKFIKNILAVFCLLFTIQATAQVKKIPVKKKPVTTMRTTTKRVTVPKIPGIRIKLTTDSGLIVIRLYESTPLHRDNFVKLASEHFFDSLLFHRVIKGFMIQGGDPSSKNAQKEMPLGSGDLGYTVPAEFDTLLFHKKGALAAARMGDDVNPQRASSGCQFYIVQGRKYSNEELNLLEMQMGRKFSAAQRLAYSTVGGTPFLDMNYTVFGIVEKGLNIIDKIAGAPTFTGDSPARDRPVGDIRMKIELIK
jgi:cyclophilin family peptidyl-prolyl cis-trans isomerase